MPRFPNNEFIGACLEFDELVAKLKAARDNHFGVDPERERDWGEVGSIQHVNELLRDACTFLNL